MSFYKKLNFVMKLYVLSRGYNVLNKPLLSNIAKKGYLNINEPFYRMFSIRRF